MFKVFYQKVPTSRSGSYTMDHTAGSVVFVFFTIGALMNAARFRISK
jgi:cytochrome oxidase Cu insertion factor (SCO1/SenC/PrrC family)